MNRTPGLLFWQIYVLAALAGVLASQVPLLGLPAGLTLFFGAGGMPWKRALLFALCVGAGAAYSSCSRPGPPEENPPWQDETAKLLLTGQVAEVSGQPDRRLRILLENVRPADDPEAAALPGRVNWSWDQGKSPGAIRPLPGQTVTLTARILPVSGFANEGGGDLADYWAERGVRHRIWTADDGGAAEISGRPGYFAAVRESWRRSMEESLGLSGADAGSGKRPASQAKAILPALIFGDRYNLDSSTLDRFTRAGLVHSLALSGQHLALAGTAAALLVWLLSRGRGRVLLVMPRRALMLVLGVPLAAAYLWIGGAPLSLIRAALMMLFGAVLWLGKRPFTLLDLLFFAALCFLLAWPRAFFDLSIQLSMLSVLGIALALPWLRRLNRAFAPRAGMGPVRRTIRRVCRGALLLAATSLAVQIVTLPILLAVFGRVNPLFFLNVIWLPAQQLAVLPLAALGLIPLIVLGPQPLSDGLFFLSALPSQAIVHLLESMDAHNARSVLQGLKPTAPAALGCAAAVIALACMPGRPGVPGVTRRLVLCAALLLPSGALEREADAWLAAREQRISLRVLDVGQAQALVLEWPEGRLLLDGGGSRSPRFDPGRDIVAHSLTRNRPPRLHTVMVSHGDLDHAGGLKAVLEWFSVGRMARSALPLRGDDESRALENIRQRRRIPLQTLREGDVFPLGQGLVLEIVHPPAAGRFSSNNGSLAVRLAHNGRGLAFLCGDAQIPTLRRILRSGRDLQADVLVLPHHGAASSLLPEFYDAVSPRLALVSSGRGNPFRFPRPEVLAALEERNIPVLNTAGHGELRVTWSRYGPPRVRTARAGPDRFPEERR
jgi:competence protein ComEC